MTRGKIKLEYIANDAERKASFKKRKKGLLNKAHELCTLCGVQACAIIYSSYEPEPTVWPSELDAQHVISRFRALPEMEQTQRMFNQESYTDQKIRKSQEQAQKLQREKKIKDLEILMHQCMAGLLNLQNVPPNYTTEMGRLADQRKQDILARMEELQKIGVVNPQMEGNHVMNFPLVNPGSEVGFGWGNVPYGFDNTDHPGPSFSTPPGNTNAGSSSNPPENDAPGPSFRN
ncbi:Agamous-like MADS-box protein AGL80 [Abeliophyllum distichum]|uniref:Agamous-like MADS-box protein AGL80 n=1 Tax=Abeliophyllum distichum TaxID=126358 RepID=A0ABD1PSJ3_9LAMI